MVFVRFAVLGQISFLTTANEQVATIEHMHMHTVDDAVSLLQYQARLSKHQAVDKIDEGWAGGYMKCTEQPEFTNSGCRTIAGGKDFAIHPRFCAEEAKTRGLDTFQFFASGDDTWCILKQCDSVDMHWQKTSENWQVFSQSCGLERSRVKIDGTCREAFTNNLIFPNPARSVCRNGLNFKTISTNNLRGVGPNRNDEGHIRVMETLPGVDLVIRADENYVAFNSARNGIHLGKFGRINMKSGTSTIFNFQFVRGGTTEPVRVNEFMFTVFDIDQFKGCYGRTSVNASHYSSYHVGANTELIVKTDAGNVGRPASSSFMSSMAGRKFDNPTKPRELTAQQLARSVSFVFKNTQFFNIGFEISDAGAGQNFLFGGRSSVVDPFCGARRNR